MAQRHWLAGSHSGRYSPTDHSDHQAARVVQRPVVFFTLFRSPAPHASSKNPSRAEITGAQS